MAKPRAKKIAKPAGGGKSAARKPARRVSAKRLTQEQRFPEGSRVPRARTISAINVTPDTAVTIPAVWACLRYLSQTVGVLPWHVMKQSDMTAEIKGAEIQTTHPVDWLLWKRPSSEWSSLQFRETLTHWALRWGNGCAEIEFDRAGRPFAMWPIHPERVTFCRATEVGEDDYGDPINPGDFYYEVNQGSVGGRAANVSLLPKRMFHIRGFGEGPVGVNVITYAAESLGWVKAAQLFGASFFGNGANVSMVVVNKKPLKPGGLEKQRSEFANLYKGPRNANKTAHLDNDADVKFPGLDAEKSQLNETNLALVADVCRWFGVPPHKVMDLSRATFSNIEHQAIEVVVDSISPWVKRFEDEADYKLFGPQNRSSLYTKINMRALMRGDNASRIAYYMGMWRMGAYSPNMILEREDENTIGPIGDIHTQQSQNVTLETIKEGKNLKSEKPADKPQDDSEDGADPEDPEDPALTESYDGLKDALADLDKVMGEKVPANV
jgi:HK97 family phage portal protein